MMYIFYLKNTFHRLFHIIFIDSTRCSIYLSQYKHTCTSYYAYHIT